MVLGGGLCCPAVDISTGVLVICVILFEYIVSVSNSVHNREVYHLIIVLDIRDKVLILMVITTLTPHLALSHPYYPIRYG